MNVSDDDAFVRSAGQASRRLRVAAIVAWVITAVLLAVIGVLAVFAVEKFGVVIPWMFIAWLVPLTGAVILTAMAVIWSATEKTASTKVAEGKSTKGLQGFLLVGIILVVVYFLRDVLLSAFTDGPGPNDGMEFLIGAGLLGGLVIAVVNGLRMEKKGRPSSSGPQESFPPDAQSPDDAARRTFQRLQLLFVAAFAIAIVYVMSVQIGFGFSFN